MIGCISVIFVELSPLQGHGLADHSYFSIFNIYHLR